MARMISFKQAINEALDLEMRCFESQRTARIEEPGDSAAHAH